MNSRRLIAFPETKDKQSYRFTSAAMHKIAVKYQGHVRFGSKSDIARVIDCSLIGTVRSTAKIGHHRGRHRSGLPSGLVLDNITGPR
jgi:hypothetical protein